MTRNRRRIVVYVLIVTVAVSGCTYGIIYALYGPWEYSTAECHLDAGVVARADAPEFVPLFDVVERGDTAVLVLARGKPHGILDSSHGWRQVIAIEIPGPSAGRTEIGGPGTRAAFYYFDGRHTWEVGDGGVRGWVAVKEVRGERVVADYDLTVDAVCADLPPEHRHREVEFRGRGRFAVKPRPSDAQPGVVWARP